MALQNYEHYYVVSLFTIICVQPHEYKATVQCLVLPYYEMCGIWNCIVFR